MATRTKSPSRTARRGKTNKNKPATTRAKVARRPVAKKQSKPAAKRPAKKKPVDKVAKLRAAIEAQTERLERLRENLASQP